VRIVFSRKGFDSATGGGPSPIVDGRPISLPIPTVSASRTTYGELGLGDHALRASRGRYGADSACHHDPMFLPDGTCLFGQCGAAQSHLANRGVAAGDVFLFFGLFREEGARPHHRIFGYLAIEDVIDVARCDLPAMAQLVGHGHPHALGVQGANDTIYRGAGRTARGASDMLRLTTPGGSPSTWRRPGWLRHGALSYHDRAERWLPDGILLASSRGQEFVADVGRRKEPREWLAAILAEITG
jgi:hypothetical protein